MAKPKYAQRPATKSVEDTLAERGAAHGDYPQQAALSQALKDCMRQSKNWDILEPHQKETLDMLCHKMARIGEGDPNHPDHWHDICGYSRLSEKELEAN